MSHEPDDLAIASDSVTGWPELVRRVRAQTPARLLAGRAGAAYRTKTQLELRSAHAAARDAVRAELDLDRDFGAEFIKRWEIFEISTKARNKDEYLLRPELGRCLTDECRAELVSRRPQDADFTVAIGDGLSVAAVSKQVPPLLELLYQHASDQKWKVVKPFVVRYCRVGILNDIGDALSSRVVVLLIGERPGLATAESLSAYLAYRPQKTHTDANRNLISNIHARGVRTEAAALRIIHLAAKMMRAGASGYLLREDLGDANNVVKGREEAQPLPDDHGL